ncbi:MAG: hypothetical protein P8X46_02405 [Nitrospirales bacterium]
MQNPTRARAEQLFAATQKKAKPDLSEKEKAQQEITERMAKQRALRLAKEATDKEIADRTKATAKNKQQKHSRRSKTLTRVG